MNLNPEVTQVKLPRQRRVNFGVVFLIVLVFAVGLFVGRYILPTGQPLAPASLDYVDVEDGQRKLVFPTYWEAWDTLHNRFIGDLDDQELFYGSVAGLVSAADDPYTVFNDPAATKQFEETIEGSFSGVGIEIGVRKGAPTVIAPLPGSPGDKAGILAGDIIVGVDETQITQDMTLDDVVRLIRGVKGTDVKLLVIHEGEGQVSEVIITRDTIEIESVLLEIEEGVAHLTITNFNGDTAARFNDAVKEMEAAGVKGIIIDVRNNPGGFLQTAVDIASRWIDKGEIVVSEKGADAKDYKAKGSTTLADTPTVILVNGGSASASEILAGALHDQIGTKVIGVKTFGKGSVQELIDFKDGSSIKVTVAKWFTPAGININEEGISPDIEVEQDRETEDIDEQLDRAREELNSLLDS